MNNQSLVPRSNGKKRGRRPVTRRRIPLPIGVPSLHRCRLNYVSHITGASNTGVQFTTTGWYINGMFAPNISGADTSQPDMFTSLAALYNNYIVERCDIDIIVANRESFTVNCTIGVYPGTKSIGSAVEAIDVGEGPFSECYILAGSSGQSRCRFRKSVPLRSLWNQQYYRGDLGFQGSSTSNPTVHASLYVNSIAATGSTMDNGIGLSVRLTFHALFSGRMGTDQVTFSDSVVNTTCDEVALLPRPSSASALV